MRNLNHILFPSEKKHRLISAFFLIGFILRMIAVVLFAELDVYKYEYIMIADNIKHGFGYSFDLLLENVPLQPTSMFTPLYVFWSLIFIIVSPGNLLPMFVGQALVSASGVIPAYLIGKKIFSNKTGIIFAALYMIYPELIILPSAQVPEFAFVVMGMWLIYFYLRLKERIAEDCRITRYAFLTGIFAGLMLLVKASGTALVIAITISLLLRRKGLFAVLKKVLPPLYAGLILTVLPWTARNYVVQNEFILLRSGYGYILWRGNHEGATGTARAMDGSLVESELSLEYSEFIDENMPFDEQDRDKFFKGEAIKFISENTGDYIALTLKRLIYFVWRDPTHPMSSNPLYWGPHLLILLASVIGFYYAAKLKNIEPVFPLTIAVFMAVNIPVMVIPRYRVISVIILMLFASFAFERLTAKIYKNG